MHASFAHFLKPTGRSWHCEDGPRSILPWLGPSGMHTAVSESDLDHLDKWLRSRTRRPHRKLEPYSPVGAPAGQGSLLPARPVRLPVRRDHGLTQERPTYRPPVRGNTSQTAAHTSPTGADFSRFCYLVVAEGSNTRRRFGTPSMERASRGSTATRAPGPEKRY